MGSVVSLPRPFPLFNFFCLLVSSVSGFCPVTGEAVVDTFFFFFFKTHLFSHAVQREGCCKGVTLACACSVSAPLGLPPLTAHTTQALGCPAGSCLRPAPGCMRLPSLSAQARLSGSPQRRRLGWACVLRPPQAEWPRRLAGAVAAA